MHSGQAAAPPVPLGRLLAAGVVDSTGLAFGWTIVLLVVTQRGGLQAAALQSAAMLVGVALSAPFSAWISARLSARDLLRVLAVVEGAFRLGLFGLLWLDVDGRLLAVVVVAMNVTAWTAFAGMRSEVARANGAGGRGRSLTWYAVAIAASEALAAGAAALLLGSTPPAAVLVAVSAGYVLSLLPQWWVGSHADPVLHRQGARSRPMARTTRQVAGPASLGAGVFALTGAPALLATVLAYELHGSAGVVVSALAFTVGSLGATTAQAAVGSWRPAALPALVLGAVMVGGWSLAGHSLAGLALAQACAGIGQCSLEGDLDTRVVARLRTARVTAGLALASSARALGGALSVALLPVLLQHVPLPRACAVAAGALLAGALAVAVTSSVRDLRRHKVTPLFAIGFAAGLVTGVVTGAVGQVRELAGVSRPSMPAWNAAPGAGDPDGPNGSVPPLHAKPDARRKPL